MAVSNYFDTLTDTEFVMDAGIVLAAFMAPGLIGPTAAGLLPVDVPNEAYGVAEVVGAEAVLSGSNKVLVQYGGMVYTLDQIANRFGVQEQVAGIIGGGN